MRPPHKTAQPEGGSEPKSRASNNQLDLTGNSFDPRSGLDGGGTAIVSEGADLARLPRDRVDHRLRLEARNRILSIGFSETSHGGGDDLSLRPAAKGALPQGCVRIAQLSYPRLMVSV